MRLAVSIVSAAVMSLCVGNARACEPPMVGLDYLRNINRVRVSVDASASSMLAGGAQSIIDGAMRWNHRCGTSNDWVMPMPLVVTSGAADAVLTVSAPGGFSGPGPDGGSSCAQIGMSTTSHNATIRLYSHAIRGSTGQTYACNWDSPYRNMLVIAHEAGHWFNLDESQCSTGIMRQPSFAFNDTNMVVTPLMNGFEIESFECDQADDLSWTPTEEQNEEILCSLNPDCDPYAPCYSSPGCTCPILVDLDRNQFHLSDRDDPVTFDIDADGLAETLTWTAEGTLDSFLCWDRDGDGRIADGKELFGNSTPLADGTIAPFGFIALAELDSPHQGGNADGWLDSLDAAYSTLCVWTDFDHDGDTDLGELRGLAAAGVSSLEVEPRTYPRRDAAGNLLLYNAKAWIVQGAATKKTATTDVFFVAIEDP